MKLLKAHKIKLNPTPEQERYFWQASAVARRAWNWALGEYNGRKIEGLPVKIKGKGDCLIKEFVTIKNSDPEWSWMNEVTTWAYQGAFGDLQQAVSNYFTKKKNGTLIKPPDWKPRKDGKPFGWPTFKARNRTIPAFYIANVALKFDGCNVQFDKGRVGWVNMAEALRFDGKVMAGRIRYQSGRWWLSVQVQVEEELPDPKLDTVYVDLGVRYLAKCSDGKVYENPKALPKMLKKLRRLQRKLDRQRRANNPDNYNDDGTVKAGPKTWIISQNMKKTEAKITKLHYRVTCLRQDASHTMTTEITENYGVIVIEDLDVSKMLKDNPTAKYLADAGLYEKRRQLEYKAAWRNGQVITTGQFEPTNKQCAACGFVNDVLRVGQEKWECPNCKRINDKYNNSLKNIKEFEQSNSSARTTGAGT